jgi:hypothetical protein
MFSRVPFGHFSFLQSFIPHSEFRIPQFLYSSYFNPQSEICNPQLKTPFDTLIRLTYNPLI